MDEPQLDSAQWISRPVPASQRIARAVTRDAVEWVAPGATLTQTFFAPGPVTAINVDIAGPPDVEDPFSVDVKFSLTLETAEGAHVAQLLVEGAQLLWERFGQLIEVVPPAPPGEYRLTLRPERHSVGWYRQDPQQVNSPDDGTAPTTVEGIAYRDAARLAGTLLIGVETIPAPNPILRRVFDLAEPAQDAMLSASVLGAGYIEINGQPVDDHTVDIPVTDYDQTVLYRTWSVAHLLQPGKNEILIHAGRERYAARGGDIWGWHLAPWHREPTALVALDVRHPDGQITSVTSGPGWETAPGPVAQEILFGGEDWIFRADAPVWSEAGVVAPPAGRLTRTLHQPPVALPSIPPVTVSTVADGDVYDFGTVISGRLHVVVSSPPGGAIEIVSGEQRDGAGRVVCDNTLAAGHAQRDTITFEGSVTDYAWQQRFSYRGFRWAQIRATGGASVQTVRAIPVYTPLEDTGELRSSSSLIDWIDQATARTFRNNLHGIPTDTPIYEKNGWTADAHLATEALLHHFDLRLAFTKWLDDHVDAQSPAGDIPQIIPTPGWGRLSDPAWSSSAVLIPWYLYTEYGDPAILSRYRDMVRRYADRLLELMPDGLWMQRSWGDWLAPDHGVGPEGSIPPGTATAVMALQHTAKLLRALGDRDAEQYDAAAARVSQAYHEKYFDNATGSYRAPGLGYRQSLNILPLAFDMVPTGHIQSVRQGLISDIETRTRGHLDAGAIAVRHLLPVLSAAGRDDLALSVLLQPDRPGWGVWHDAGENTLLESWDQNARSRNHYFLGSVSSWIQQRVGGLRATAPGWSSFDVHPVDDPRVRHASIWHQTPHGIAAVDWSRGAGGWDLRIRVPEGVHATVSIEPTARALPAGEHRVRIENS